MNSRRPARIPNDHGRHDRLLVARLAADDAYPTETAEARSLVEACAQCAALAADIRLVRSATSVLVAPQRPRDFRLSAADADRLRGSSLDRFLRRLAMPGLAPLRPVAAGVMSLGLALAVVGAALPSPASVPEENAAIFTERAVDMGAPQEGIDIPAASPMGEPIPAAGEGDGVAGEAEDITEESAALTGADEPSPLRDLLIIAGLLLTVVALAVLVLVSLARRRWMDPLLR